MIPILEILPVFSVFPYALLFYAIPLASVGLALFAFKRADPSNNLALRRSLLVIFFSQLILLTLNLMIYQGFQQLSQIFPIAFRALTLLCVIWLTRALFWQSKPRQSWWIWVITSLILLTASILAVLWLPLAGQKSFNGSWEDLSWVAVTLLTIALSAIIYLRRDRSDRIEGVVILILAAMGFVFYLALPNAGSLPSAVMVSQLLYYPLLISLAWQQRKSAQVQQPKAAHDDRRELTGEVAARLLDISLQHTDSQIQRALTHSLGLYLMADLCGFLVGEPENANLSLQNTYDLIREEFLKPVEVPAKSVPVLAAHLEDREALVANGQEELAPEKQVLMDAIGYNQIGNLLFYPLSPIGSPTARGLICLSPYTGRAWQDGSLRLISQIALKINEILDEAADIEQKATSAQRLQLLLNQVQRDRANTVEQFLQSQHQLEQLRQELGAANLAHEDEVELWLARQEALETHLEELQSTLQQNEAAVAQAESLKVEKERLEQLMAQNAQKVEGLRSALDQARGMLEQMSSQSSDPAAKSDLEFISALESEIQTFMDDSPEKQISARFESSLLAQPHPQQAAQLLQLSRSLLKNAFAVSQPGSNILLEILPSGEYPGFIELRVSDFGPGLTPEDQVNFLSTLDDKSASQPWGDTDALREAASLAQSLGGHWWIHSVPDTLTIHRLAIPATLEVDKDA